MQQADRNTPRSLPRAIRKYGPLGFILVALGVLTVMVVVNEPAVPDQDASKPTPDGGASPGIGAPEPTGSMPMTFDEAVEAGSVEDHDWGERCDDETGKVKLPTLAAMPCVPVFEGDNGGATSPGVTADTIRVVFYSPNPVGDMTALLATANADEEPEDRVETVRQFIDIFASRAELYGRRIEMVEFKGTGADDDVIAAKADAREIIADLDPFLVFSGPALDRGTFAEELARNGVMCFECGQAIPDSVVQKNAGMIWGPLPSTDQYLSTLFAWIDPDLGDDSTQQQRDAIAKAVFAGDEEFRDRERKTGVIHFDQDPPIFEESAGENEGRYGSTADRQSYILDFSTMPEKAAEIIAKFKADEITTIVFLGDPIMPGYLTSQATSQDYHPEWVFTGTVLTDSNIFGRFYDQAQMAHAFGISQLRAPLVQDQQIDVSMYRWWTGNDEVLPPAEAQYAILVPRAKFLVDGIHMAGPDLTAETFRDGLFRIPPTPSGASIAQVSYGNWGYFPETDYQGIDDSAEIWWDGDVEAVDEIGNPGRGVWRRAHNGKRFVGSGDSPPLIPNPFANPEETVTVLNEIPAGERPPSYPPPPGSPAAG